MDLSKASKLLLILVISTYVFSGTAHAWNWSWGSNHSSGSIGSSHNHTTPRRKIEVTVWKNGFDYQEWASKHAPFYTNDVLVFKYNKNDQSQSITKHNNNNDVYLLPDSRSYKRCDVSRGTKVVASGGSSLGFKLLLRDTQTYYLASGDHNSCNDDMKFSLPRRCAEARETVRIQALPNS